MRWLENVVGPVFAGVTVADPSEKKGEVKSKPESTTFTTCPCPFNPVAARAEVQGEMPPQ